MIELIFSDSGAAALGKVKKTGDKSSLCYTKITTDGVGNEVIETIPHEPYNGPMIDGDLSDVAAIWLMGDVGDISVLPDWSSRLRIMREISDAHELEPDEWVEQEGKRAESLVCRLRNAADSREGVRIWWSDIAHETCGYYWALSILKNATGCISSVKVPRIWAEPGGYKIINGTQELEPQDFYSLLRLEKQTDLPERKAIAAHWKTLVAENAPLRVVINGLPCSVSEDFYDFAIFQSLPDRDFRIAEAIGRAIEKGPGGVADWWYARRIRHFIDCGELEIVESGNKFYYATARKAAH